VSGAAPLELFAHPFSSYCQKVLVALWEKEIAFEYRMLSPEQPENGERLNQLWPFGKFPILVHQGRTIAEASIIIEYLDGLAPDPRFVPDRETLEVRFMDRVFDNYLMTPVMRMVLNAIRAPEQRDPIAVTESEAMLDTSYAWLDARMAGREWAATDAFTLADCAAAPALFYADWVRRIPDQLVNLKAYRARLLARPSYARAVEEARPYRSLFPLGAPDRD
jgi:glutathione S-transferase